MQHNKAHQHQQQQQRQRQQPPHHPHHPPHPRHRHNHAEKHGRSDSSQSPHPPNTRPRRETPQEQVEGGGNQSSKLYHPFKASFNDHFETSLEALRDVCPALEELRALTRPSTPELFTLYDPYYCAGTIVDLWGQLGFARVLHENRDFYEDVEKGTVPGPYDVLVTNPPFSDDHIPRLMRFLLGSGKPWAFVAPDYIAAKDWYVDIIREHFEAAPPTGKGDIHATARRAAPAAVFAPPPFLLASDSTSADATTTTTASKAKVGVEPFYIVPRAVYDFKHPLGVGKEHSHFRSMWYVWMGRHTKEVLRATRVALARAGGGLEAVHGLAALKEGQYVAATAKRANPAQRSRQHQQQQHRKP